MDTLDLLKMGQLAGTKRLDLAAELTQFPTEILTLSDSLEILNLTNNQLNSLPDEFACLQKLKILFLSNNNFEELPEVLGQCSQLTMMGFKANQIRTVSEGALPASVRWLILTNNQIQTLPTSIAQLHQLQKLMLAGNCLRSLPAEMVACQNLELIRISANQFEVLPEWLLTLPRLAWLAVAGNPFCAASMTEARSLPLIDWSELQVGELLGEGASGVIYRGVWEPRSLPNAKSIAVAIKLFKGAVTSDGLPTDEMAAYVAAGVHPNLVQVLGKLHNHPTGQAGLVFAFIPSDYQNLGHPPNFESCTRDTYSTDARFPLTAIARIGQAIAAAAAHLHEQGLMHGDLYAHNILVNSTGDSLLGDFGAASVISATSPATQRALEQIEVRAFGCLLEDLLDRCQVNESSPQLHLFERLRQLQHACFNPTPGDRPLFSTICQSLANLNS